MDVSQGSSSAAVPAVDPGVSSAASPPDPVSAALANVGRELGADRVALFENIRDPDGRLWMNLTSEWRRNGVRGVFDDPSTTLHPYSPDFIRWIEVLGDHRVLSARILAAEGTVSFVAVPIAVDDGWWGFLSVDDCSGGRSWGAGEIELLRAVAGSIAADVQRQRQASADEIVGDRYRSIVEHIPAVTYIDALDDAASTIYMSPQVEQLLGYAPEEWIADPDLWLRTVHPDDRPRAIAENQRHNETGESFSLDYRMYRKDGRIVWIRDEARIVRDERGIPTFSLGVMFDVTEMKRGDEKVAFLT
ncbi:MAG: diguanylate cyclase/phosphodiesterase with and sensor(s), partial [Actinomycetia bacterium]|nr:diguanylate cyclase/phosphodiesterase with and sensor(s) [Actinomycetes bacterium]